MRKLLMAVLTLLLAFSMSAMAQNANSSTRPNQAPRTQTRPKSAALFSAPRRIRLSRLKRFSSNAPSTQESKRANWTMTRALA